MASPLFPESIRDKLMALHFRQQKKLGGVLTRVTQLHAKIIAYSKEDFETETESASETEAEAEVLDGASGTHTETAAPKVAVETQAHTDVKLT